MKNGAALKLLAEEIQQTMTQAFTHEELKPYAKALGEQLQLSQEVLDFLLPFAMKGNYERFLSDATIFMEFFGTIVVAWQWLKMAVQAKQALVTGKTTYGESFYQSNIHTMKFFFKYEVPKTKGLADILMNEEVLTILEQKELIS